MVCIILSFKPLFRIPIARYNLRAQLDAEKEVEKEKEKEISRMPSFATRLPETLKGKGIRAKKCNSQSGLISLVKC